MGDMDSSRGWRMVATVAGAVLVLLSVGLMAAGSAMLWVHSARRDAAGYYTTPVISLQTSAYALTFNADLPADSVGWVPSDVLGKVRVRATAADQSSIFIGVAPRADVTSWLSGVAHQPVTVLGQGSALASSPKGAVAQAPAPPSEQTLWVASTHGPGTQTLTWAPRSGSWTVVIMNTDAAAGIAVRADAGISSTLLLPIGVVSAGMGLIVLAVGALLLVLGLGPGLGERPPTLGGRPEGRAYPATLQGRLDPDTGRWLWLFKWLLVIPHWLVLLVLWPAALLLTLVAGLAVLITGRYPRPIFTFNVGVVRWTWRVAFYAIGAFATDRYPPFSLMPDSRYPADLEIQYPERLSRGLVLVKWWLLALPHYLVLAFFAGGWWVGWRGAWPLEAGGGLIGLLALVGAVVLMFRGRYPASVFDFVMGMDRWCFRVLAYVLLMRDEYPPFRLDQGGRDPGSDTVGASPPSGGGLAGAPG